jgi:hypothetical protein
MKNNKPFLPAIILFIIVVAASFVLRNRSAAWGVDFDVLLIGACIVFFTTAISSWLLQRSLSSSNPQSFVRATYGSFIIKFFVLVIAAFIYIMAEKKQVNKPALFACLGLYFIFTFIEVSQLTRMLKQKKNA